MSVTHPSKRRKLSPPEERMAVRSKGAGPTKQQESAFFRNAGQWDLEKQYEERARKGRKKEKASTRLPIKDFEGRIEQVEAPDAPPAADDAEDSDNAEGEGSEGQDKEENDENQKPHLSSREEILEAKEELARVAGLINESPEEHIGRLKRLAEVGQSRNATVKKLALATQMTVYKDIIPGYRIREWSDSDTGGRLTKEVKALRNFEQGLVSSYQAYVRELAKLAQPGKGQVSEAKSSLSSTAVTCATSLLLAVPHFNFRGDLVKILVDRLSVRRVNDDYTKCLRALESLFADDEDGKPSLDTVIMLTRMMKARNYNVDESVLNTFLHLRLLSEFSFKGSQNAVDRSDGQSANVPKKQRVFRTKKERKTAKELKQVEKEMKEADAIVGREERDKMQAETLKLVFTTYFKILKTRSGPLMGAVLEGLAKYAHLINQDFFGDILEVLRELCAQAAEDNDGEAADSDDEEATNGDQEGRSETRRVRWSDPQRAVLLCTTTAFELLSSQEVSKAASGLHLDLSFFTSTLYRILPTLSLAPDLELSSKSLHVPDPRTISGAPAKVNARATATLLIRALSGALMPRPTPQARVAAFTHRLSASALHTPERSATALLGVMNQVARVHGRKIAALWDTEERRGDGNFDPAAADLELANPYAGTVWAGELLRLHYAPSVREGVTNLEKLIAGSQGKG